MTSIKRQEIYWTMYTASFGWLHFQKSGFCGMLCSMGYLVDDNTMFLYFPELSEQRPRHYDRYWHSVDEEGWDIRRKKLLRAIELTYELEKYTFYTGLQRIL